MTLAEINDELGAARTNKKEFLEKMDSIILWITFIKLVQPHYYKGERGNKPYPLELMLRIFILQNLYDYKFYWIILLVSGARYRWCTVR